MFGFFSEMRLSNADRARDIGQIEAGRNLKVVAAALLVSKSTVTRLHQRYIQIGSVEDRSRSCQQCVTTQRTDRPFRLAHLRQRPATESTRAQPTKGQPSDISISRLWDVDIHRRRLYYGAHVWNVWTGQLSALTGGVMTRSMFSLQINVKWVWILVISVNTSADATGNVSSMLMYAKLIGGVEPVEPLLWLGQGLPTGDKTI